MTKPAIGVIVLVLALVVRVPAFANWTVEVTKDSMTDETTKVATVKNDAGYSLTIYRNESGDAWTTFALGPTSLDTLSPRHAPTFRVDKNSPIDLDAARSLTEQHFLGMTLYAWEPRWINFAVWYGKDNGSFRALTQFTSGSSVVFRYYLGTGGYKETTFSLAGAGGAIAAALGVPLQADPEKQKYSSEVGAAAHRCRRNLETRPACEQKVKACQDASLGIDAFHQCTK